MRQWVVCKFKEWFRPFKERQTSVENDAHSERPYMSRNQVMIDEVRSAVLDEQRITIRELSDKLGLSFGSVQSISDRRFGHEM
jgi:DNA replicative helicase MCM subunit Mcm2 (Cdc46/Mcm family)